jgi:hypothetical protein
MAIFKRIQQQWHEFNHDMKEQAFKDETDLYYDQKTKKNDEQIPLLAKMFVYAIGLLALFAILHGCFQEIHNLSIRP